jgi:holo-ACP synthase/triphosphoribosyl-dephospho-CoA synthase
MERPVSVQDVLAARDERAARQQRFLAEHAAPLISFTMNIAGPVKVTPLIERGFRHGCRQLELQMQRVRGTILYREVLVQPAGCEAYFVTDLPADRLKQLTVELEEGSELGRLYDMDVLNHEGKKLDRAGERTCLICGQPCRACARSRAHSMDDLLNKINEILSDAGL